MTKTLLSTFALAVATLCLGCGSADGSATARVDEVHGAATFERGCDGVLSGACDRGCRSDTDCAHGSRCELTREGEFYRGRCAAVTPMAAGEDGFAPATPEPSPPIRADVAWERDAGIALVDAALPSVIDAAAPKVDAAPPPTTAPSCTNGSWERLPSKLRSIHTAVGVGSKVFLFGGYDGDGASVLQGSVYDPQTGVEVPLPKGGPDVPDCEGASSIEAASLVVLVCGGSAHRFDLVANQWRASAKTNVHERSVSGAPHIVYVPTARGVFLWNASTRTGAHYDALTDTFTNSPALGAPSSTCCGAGASGDGSVYLWGGHEGASGVAHSEGARLDLGTMTWTALPTVNAPAPRRRASLGFVAGRLMVLGGDERAFDPKAGAWSAVPASGLTAYGGSQRVLATGTKLVVVPTIVSGAMRVAVYDAQATAWSMATTSDAPRDRHWHAVALAGDDVVVHGGLQYGTPSRSMFDDGYHFAYSLAARAWRHGEGEAPVFNSSGDTSGGLTTLVWSEANKRAVAWGGGAGAFSGGQFNPATKTWTSLSMANAPTGGWYPTSTWTGSKMLVHAYDGARGGALLGAAYDPLADAWTPWSKGPSVTAAVAPLLAVAGGKALTWSGSGFWLAPTATGNVHDANMAASASPASPVGGPGAVEATTTSLVPIGGSRLAVWGGYRDSNAGAGNVGGYVDEGFIFDAALGTWSKVSALGAPTPRSKHGMAWTGTELFVWGGFGADGTSRDDGALYNPKTDTWRPVAAAGAPSARYRPLAVWTGNRVIVWGGSAGASGAAYDPATDAWHCMPSERALPRRMYRPLGVWTGSELVVMGGANGPTNTVAIYRP